MKKFLIAASILNANFACLGEEIKNVIQSGGDIIHFDVMDNHYVPNLTFGPLVLKSLRDYGINVPIDVHLMVNNVDSLIPAFANAGANSISFHPETSNHIDRSIQIIKNNGCKAGIAFNPATSLHYIKYIIDKIDFILLMLVNPGFGNQNIIPITLKKIKTAKKLIKNSKYNVLIEVDGGIKVNNIQKIASLGADLFVVGSEIFNNINYKKIIKKMRFELKKYNF